MITTSTPDVSPSGSIASKRRYSSIAVEFPIRYALNAHTQRDWGVYPSWVGARRACIYVQAHENCRQFADENPPYNQASPCNNLTNDGQLSTNDLPRCTTNPRQLPTNIPSGAHQRPVNNLQKATQVQLTTPNAAYDLHPFGSRFARQFQCTPTAFTPQQQSKKSPTIYLSLTVHLRFTWESLEAVNYSILVRPAHDHGQTPAHSRFVGASCRNYVQTPLELL